MGLTINPIKLEGSWRGGYALDLATLSSTPIGHGPTGRMMFETKRPEIGEHLFQLKYRDNKDSAGPIIDTAANFIQPSVKCFDILVPIPPSKNRQLQPVIVLAEGISRKLALPYEPCITTTRATGQHKDIADLEERKKEMDGLYTVDAAKTTNRRILLFDDVYDTGTTLNAITELLLNKGKAASVDVLTITKTRSRS